MRNRKSPAAMVVLVGMGAFFFVATRGALIVRALMHGASHRAAAPAVSAPA
ncbi:MAG: hypothetical protein OEY03_13880 [Rhizobacter sp.]|nr:hypothetical protein [Rhizobacter sp.]